MKSLSDWAIAALALITLGPGALGCGGEDSSAAEAQPPQAVAPVEVTADDEASGAEGDEVTELRARVAELEGQLAQCGCEVPPAAPQAPTESGTQTATVPEGVDVPEGAQAAAASADTDGDGAGDSNEAEPEDETRTARRRRDPTLLGTLLGDEEEAERERRRARRQSESDEDPETIELPNPASILLGE